MMILPHNRFKNGKWYEEGFIAYDDHYMNHHHFIPSDAFIIERATGKKTPIPNVFTHGMGFGDTKEAAVADLSVRMKIPCPVKDI